MKKKKPFTLMEMLVSIAILIVLLGLAIGGINTYLTKADKSKARSDLRIIEQHLEMYLEKNSTYPFPAGAAGWVDLDAATLDSIGLNPDKYSIKSDSSGNPLDPWDQSYRVAFYNKSGYQIYTPYSKGPEATGKVGFSSGKMGHYNGTSWTYTMEMNGDDSNPIVAQ